MMPCYIQGHDKHKSGERTHDGTKQHILTLMLEKYRNCHWLVTESWMHKMRYKRWFVCIYILGMSSSVRIYHKMAYNSFERETEGKNHHIII